MSDDEEYVCPEDLPSVPVQDMFFNKELQPIDVLEWARLSGDRSYRFVARTRFYKHKRLPAPLPPPAVTQPLPDPRTASEQVITVWWGHDRYLTGMPLMFETTAFVQLRQENTQSGLDLEGDGKRWVRTSLVEQLQTATLVEALDAHETAETALIAVLGNELDMVRYETPGD